jgi:hypothetical protein
VLLILPPGKFLFMESSFQVNFTFQYIVDLTSCNLSPVKFGYQFCYGTSWFELDSIRNGVELSLFFTGFCHCLTFPVVMGM